MNTGILLILPNANLDEIGLPLAVFFKGMFYDFTPKWYTAVGYTLTQTMIIVASWPFIEFGMFYTKLWLERKLDGSSSNAYNTKKTNI